MTSRDLHSLGVLQCSRPSLLACIGHILLSLEFIDNDEQLLIIGKGPEEKLKFMVWDLYNTGKVETTTLDDFLTIENFGTPSETASVHEVLNGGIFSQMRCKSDSIIVSLCLPVARSPFR